MEKRDRDKVSRNDPSSTEEGDLNRESSSRIGNQRDDRDDNPLEPNRRMKGKEIEH